MNIARGVSLVKHNFVLVHLWQLCYFRKNRILLLLLRSLIRSKIHKLGGMCVYTPRHCITMYIYDVWQQISWLLQEDKS